jgi:hypothetical protein
MMENIKALAANLWFMMFGGKGELNELKSKTALLVKNDITKYECEKIKEKINEIIENQCSIVWSDEEGADKRIFEFEKYYNGLYDLLKIDEKIKNIEFYTGRKIESWTIMANKICHAKNNKGSGGGWHKDSAFSHQVKYIWYLTNVNEDNGPFQFVRGTNKIKRYGNNPIIATRFEDILENEKTELVLGGAGDLLICDTSCVHRGKPIEQGVRYAISLYTFNAKSAKNKMLAEVYN